MTTFAAGVHPVVGAATAPTNNFLDSFAAVCRGAEPTAIAAWVAEHLDEMNEAMFFADFDWSRLSPEHMLLLRSMATPEVFSAVAKGGFLSKVSSNPELLGLADILFSPNFLGKLPPAFQKARYWLEQIMAWAADLRSHH